MAESTDERVDAEHLAEAICISFQDECESEWDDRGHVWLHFPDGQQFLVAVLDLNRPKLTWDRK